MARASAFAREVATVTVLTVANQKGGVAKTTSALYLAWIASLRRQRRTLLVDFDPQHSLSRILGIAPYPAFGVEHALQGKIPLQACARELTGTLALLPADAGLARWAACLASAGEGELPDLMLRLRASLHRLRGYDLVIVDSTPAADRMGMAACLAADCLLVSTQAQDLSRSVATDFLQQCRRACTALGADVRVAGILINIFDRRLRVERENRELLREAFGALVLDTEIPRSSAALELAHRGGPLRHRASSRGRRLTEAYAQAFDEIEARLHAPQEVSG